MDDIMCNFVGTLRCLEICSEKAANNLIYERTSYEIDHYDSISTK
jgi:hypothetical protein